MAAVAFVSTTEEPEHYAADIPVLNPKPAAVNAPYLLFIAADNALGATLPLKAEEIP